MTIAIVIIACIISIGVVLAVRSFLRDLSRDVDDYALRGDD